MAGSVFPVRQLRDIGVSLLDCEHSTPKPATQGFPYIAIPNIVDGRLDLTDVRRISREDLAFWTRKTEPKAEDIIMTRRGRVGDTAVIPKGLACAIGQNLVILRSNGEFLDQRYLRWALRGPMYEEQKEKYLNVGAVFDSLNCRDIPKFEIPVPPLPEQRAIAHILGSLDDKIELNRRMNATLEGIAQALFKSWFVDFAPVRAKAEGRQPYGMDADTAALFPASFQDSAFGEIPKDWQVLPLGACVSYLSRGVAPKYVESSPIRALNQRAIRWWHIDDSVLKYHDPHKPIRAEAYIQRDDVVINSTGDITIGRGYWFYHDVDNLFADSHVSIVRTDKHILFPELLVFQLQTTRHQELIYGHVTGSTGQLELNRSTLATIPFLCPRPELQEVFSHIITPWFRLIWQNKLQSATLITLRDTLLPKLLSGEIRVKEAEELVEAHA